MKEKAQVRMKVDRLALVGCAAPPVWLTSWNCAVLATPRITKMALGARAVEKQVPIAGLPLLAVMQGELMRTLEPLAVVGKVSRKLPVQVLLLLAKFPVTLVNTRPAPLMSVGIHVVAAVVSERLVEAKLR